MRNGKHIDTSKLRHVVSIQEKTYVQDSSGDMIVSWVDKWPVVFANIEPLSAREFVASANLESKVAARITIHFRDGLDSSMRIVHGSKLYNIEGILPDLDSGREYITIPCSYGTNEG